MNLFDICVIVASDPEQAEIFRKMIDVRIAGKLYPAQIEFRVLSDPKCGRVGSGGGTFHALSQIEEAGKKKVLMIHAGGESRRLPCFVPEGKLFAPAPSPSSSIISPVMLDLILSLYIKYPWNRGELVIITGDVVIDFSTDSIPPDREDVCGFAAPASFEQGSRHGVFRFDRSRERVIDFYQKAEEAVLRKNTALEGTDSCPLDIGIISMSPQGISVYKKLGDILNRNGDPLKKRIALGTTRFDLYLEFMTACLKDIHEEEYLAKVAKKSSLEEYELKQIYSLFKQTSLKGVLTKDTSFIHFGSAGEYPAACRQILDKGLVPFYQWQPPEMYPVYKKPGLVFNSDATVEKTHAGIEENSGGITFSDEVSGADWFYTGGPKLEFKSPICEGFLIDVRSVTEGFCFCIYHRNDSFKETPFKEAFWCGVKVQQWLEERRIKASDLGIPEDREFNLYKTPFFPVLESELLDKAGHFLPGFWDSRICDNNWKEKYLRLKRYSLTELNMMTDPVKRDQERTVRRINTIKNKILNSSGWFSLSSRDFRLVFKDAPSKEITLLFSIYKNTNDPLLKSYRRTLLIDSLPKSKLPAELSSQVDISYVEKSVKKISLSRGVKQDQIVWSRSPVRFDLAGGWTDTPPYTLREGGAVLNLAADLNGQPPIQVFCRPSKEKHIRFHSIDLGVTETITTFRALEDYNNPTSPFSLPKASAVLLGITKQSSGKENLSSFLDLIGCGLEMTLLCAVPKGSGLGTSSILAAAILAGLHRFFGRFVPREELYRQVLQVEQMLTTGGGWQDQIGGVVGGIKLIETAPGMRLLPALYQLDPYLFTEPAYHAKFTLFYTGVTRLAKNILQEVVHNFNTLNPRYLFTFRYITDLAKKCRDIIARRDLNGLGVVLNESWKSNLMIHPSTTNEQVQEILTSVESYYSGMKLLGAGGGGYALFLSPTIEDAEKLRDTLSARSRDDKARLVDFSLNPDGLRVTVS
ncbi:MAG: L-fucokinase [Spirochaetia bacterium]